MGLEMHRHRIDGYGSALELGRDGLKIPKAGLLPASCRRPLPHFRHSGVGSVRGRFVRAVAILFVWKCALGAFRTLG